MPTDIHDSLEVFNRSHLDITDLSGTPLSFAESSNETSTSSSCHPSTSANVKFSRSTSVSTVLTFALKPANARTSAQFAGAAAIFLSNRYLKSFLFGEWAIAHGDS
jgi:hypothetical protein